MDFIDYIIYCISSSISAGFGDVGTASWVDLLIGTICLYSPIIFFGLIKGISLLCRKIKNRKHNDTINIIDNIVEK